jgi:hypothetical protein
MEINSHIPEQETLGNVTLEMLGCIREHMESRVHQQNPNLHIFVKHTTGVISVFKITREMTIEAYDKTLLLHQGRLKVIIPYEEMDEVAVSPNNEIDNQTGLPAKDATIFHYKK